MILYLIYLFIVFKIYFINYVYRRFNLTVTIYTIIIIYKDNRTIEKNFLKENEKTKLKRIKYNLYLFHSCLNA